MESNTIGQHILGYKSFFDDMTCLNKFQYELGQTYTMDPDKIELYKSGFHFCINTINVPTYNRSKFAVIKAEGKIIHRSDISVCSQITIVKLITLDEFRKLHNRHVDIQKGLIEYKDQDGRFHREDGPAIEWLDGTKAWYINGKFHRTDGPAIEWKSGTKEWYLNGKRHREDGPAVEKSNGVRQWYLNGKQYTENEYAEEEKKRI